MADVAVQHSVAGAYEPSLFGTYSKKIGMWLFLLSDSLTFGALLFAYSYGRVSTPNWPTPFGKASIVNATIMTVCLLSSSLTMVLGVLASKKGDHKATVKWLLATMFFGALFVVLHAKEWSGLINEGLRPFSNPWAKNVPQFGGTFFTLTGMHMLHVTIGVCYLGVVALRKKWLPILLGIWLLGWLLTPATNVFHIGIHVLLLVAVVSAVILVLRPKVYDAHDVEIAGLYWHFVDLVWMFIFPLVYLMSTKVV
ncbi:MAG TPA: cytochrome c oxidase subunit 3 [Terriglobales bacterium]|jgi:cytochrome c oxidase subunit 3|nr:cytochrome c oxidase subunit 3 [Terriglobales bacterium]